MKEPLTWRASARRAAPPRPKIVNLSYAVEKKMERKIVRTYAFKDSEVHEALCAWLRSKDMPAPDYVADTPTCKWIKEPKGIRVEWTDESEMVL